MTMPIRVEEQDRRLVVIDDEADPQTDSGPLVAATINRLSARLFCLLHGSEITPDGFALVRLNKVKFNHIAVTQDTLRRYVSVSQQAKLGKCLIPWLAFPLIGLWGLISIEPGKHRLSSASFNDTLFLAAFILMWCGCAWSLLSAQRTVMEIAEQFYDEEPPESVL
jgi:hypothetical protein